MNERLSYEEKKELPDSIFGLPERREYPMPDAAHVRAAEAYFRYCPEKLKPRLARAILARAPPTWGSTLSRLLSGSMPSGRNLAELMQ